MKTPLDLQTLVDALFTNGSGEKADRLVLTVDSTPKRDLGGWCRGAVVDRLREALASVPAPESGTVMVSNAIPFTRASGDLVSLPREGFAGQPTSEQGFAGLPNHLQPSNLPLTLEPQKAPRLTDLQRICGLNVSQAMRVQEYVQRWTAQPATGDELSVEFKRGWDAGEAAALLSVSATDRICPECGHAWHDKGCSFVIGPGESSAASDALCCGCLAHEDRPVSATDPQKEAQE